MQLVMAVDARDPLFYRCPDLEVLLTLVFVVKFSNCNETASKLVKMMSCYIYLLFVQH
jgi:hypothetical protein